MSESLKNKTVRGVFWSSVERFSVQGVQFIVQIILARLLLPEDYGLIAMLSIFLAISQTLINSGFTNALIRKLDCTDVDYSTVFYFNIVVGIVLYFILFFSAPFIASFYKAPELINLTKVIGLTLIINSLTVVQRARFTKNVDFKIQSKASFSSVIISGIVAVYLAYNGFGVWALAIQAVIQGLINMVMLWILSKWKPLWVFSWKSFREMFSFGSRLLIASILTAIVDNINRLLIGRVYSKQELGYYTRGSDFTHFPADNLTAIFGRVTFPLLSELQNDNDRLQGVYRRYIRLLAFIIFPVMMGMAALAKPLVVLLLTEKWLGAVIFLQILSFARMWHPVHALNLNLLQVKGRSDLYLRVNIAKKIVTIIMLLIAVRISVVAVAIGTVISSLIALAINTHYTGKLINITFFKQMKDLAPTLLYSISMFGVVWGITQFIPGNLLKLIIGFIIGVVYYIFIAYISKSSELKEVFSLIAEYKTKLANKRNKT